MIEPRVTILSGPAPGAAPLEMAERKGRGHPDSICDALAENLSIGLARFYLGLRLADPAAAVPPGGRPPRCCAPTCRPRRSCGATCSPGAARSARWTAAAGPFRPRKRP